MFRSARIKLTLYYLFIIMVISLLFSGVVYRGVTFEIERGVRRQAVRMMPFDEFFPNDIHEEIITEAKQRVALELVIINFCIFIVSGTAGYFLAGKTLKPIAEMVDEQKQFVADASHELRTPLTAIKTENEVALRDKKLDLKFARELIKSNLEEINNLKSLTDYFLTLSKYQDANTKLQNEVFDLSRALQEVINRLKPMARVKNIEFSTKLDSVKVRANKISIIELITILVDNAIKYSHENGEVKVEITHKNNTAILKVEDFGVGIKAEDIGLIFNRFYRADSSRTKNQAVGYGLGLSIAKSIADLNCGKIVVNSTFGKGSTFTFFLPSHA